MCIRQRRALAFALALMLPCTLQARATDAHEAQAHAAQALAAEVRIAPTRAVQTRGVVLIAADGVRVYGMYASAGSRAKAIILLFHMARSNYGEYEPIVPTLVAQGYDCLAIDQRSGAPAWGRSNGTVAHIGGDPTTFLAAMPDLEAALAWAKARAHGKPIIAWGSSYSAALVYLLAARHPHDIAAVMAFSPGEYLGDGQPVHTAAAKIRAPIFVDSAANAWEESQAASILAASPSTRKVQLFPHHGAHGALALRIDYDPRGAAEHWKAVLAFLHSVAP